MRKTKRVEPRKKRKARKKPDTKNHNPIESIFSHRDPVFSATRDTEAQRRPRFDARPQRRREAQSSQQHIRGRLLFGLFAFLCVLAPLRQKSDATSLTDRSRLGEYHPSRASPRKVEENAECDTQGRKDAEKRKAASSTFRVGWSLDSLRFFTSWRLCVKRATQHSVTGRSRLCCQFV